MTFDIWSNMTTGIMDFALSGFEAMDPFFYPLVFLGIAGYVFTAMNSVTAAIAAILVTLGAFGGSTTIFKDVPELTILFYIITIIGLSLLVFLAVLKARKR